MNVISMLFDMFWGITGNIVSLSYFTSILKRKYLIKVADNKHFHHFNNFFQIVVEALVIILCMYLAGCLTIELFHT